MSSEIPKFHRVPNTVRDYFMDVLYRNRPCSIKKHFIKQAKETQYKLRKKKDLVNKFSLVFH